MSLRLQSLQLHILCAPLYHQSASPNLALPSLWRRNQSWLYFEKHVLKTLSPNSQKSSCPYFGNCLSSGSASCNKIRLDCQLQFSRRCSTFHASASSRNVPSFHRWNPPFQNPPRLIILIK